MQLSNRFDWHDLDSKAELCYTGSCS